MKRGKIISGENDIYLTLDSYEDIFSDFDPRHYSERALSEDFLSECRKASSDKEEKINLKLLLPKQKRNLSEETNIKKRLKEHFHKHFIEKKNEIHAIKLSGLRWFILGCGMLIITSFFGYNTLSYSISKPFIVELIMNIAHPAGWFFMWEGLGKIFISAKEKFPSYHFYRKMNGSAIYFFDETLKR